MVIIKSDVDKLLTGLLGNDLMVIELWWNTANLFFQGRSPLFVYQNVDNGHKIVYDYVLKFSLGEYS